MRTYILLLCFALFVSCAKKESADLIIRNGSIYTMNPNQSSVDVIVVKGNAIVYVGDESGASKYEGKVLDLKGKTLVPGMHEGHAHIMGVGYNLLNVDLMGAQSYTEVIKMVKARADQTPKGQWIVGRGWHQDKWVDQPESMYKNLPTHYDLSSAVPDHPVYLRHSSGHMGLANAMAMEMAGVSKDIVQPDGGEIFMEMNEPTGIFNETAESFINDIVPSNNLETNKIALGIAVNEALKNGITTFHDASDDTVTMKTIDFFKEYASAGDLKIRLYLMLNSKDSALLDHYFLSGPEIGLYDDYLTIRSVKIFGDGALGSRGAWLIEEYEDASGNKGAPTTSPDYMRDVTERAYNAGFQVNTHAIGDMANRNTLNIYEDVFKLTSQEDPRFRIEHAQHLHPDDIPRFAELGIIASMQAIHMSSDRPWAINRLGKKRIDQGAYMWQALLKSGVKIVNGTDAPVEPISPIANFYASVSRKTLSGTPKGGYEPAQKMTREQTLRSMTLDAAYGAFLEDMVGSIEVGKLADFTIFDQDIMTIEEDKILETRVVMTIVDGQIVFKKQ